MLFLFGDIFWIFSWLLKNVVSEGIYEFGVYVFCFIDVRIGRVGLD